MDRDKALALLQSIQRAFEEKDIRTVLKFYHPDICFISPAFPEPIEGLEALKVALRRHFSSPQRTSISFHNIEVQNLDAGNFIIRCRIDGFQSMLLSGQRFAGYLSRVFVDGEAGPLIMHEHLSLRQ
jgi:ketosteroid isomerase-like protein